MEMKRDYYEILGISRNADEGTVKKAYRKLAKKYHPDTNGGNAQAEQKFKEITEAYVVLSDQKKRRLYDQLGHSAFDGSMGNGGNASYGDPNGACREYHFEGGGADDMFGSIFGDIFPGSGFGNSGFERGYFGNGRFYGRNVLQKGADVESGITIRFEEAVFGGERVVTLCDENGQMRSLKIRIPAGIDTGKSIRLRGKGRPGRNGGENGDLLLRVTVLDKPGFRRQGMDVYTTVQVPFTTAVCGGEVRVKTISGDVLCKIREGTQSGTRLRLRGKGIVSMKNPSVRGDQYVTVQIQVPQNLSPEAKRRLRELKA